MKKPIPGAVKYDNDKAPLFTLFRAYFPNASRAVAEVSAFGAKKYAPGGWRHVENGVARYSDALDRHLTLEASGEITDPETGLRHAAHVAWNALARLELILAAEDRDKLDGSSGDVL